MGRIAELTQSQQAEPTFLQDWSSVGTLVASAANFLLVGFAIIQLVLLRRQVRLAQSQTAAATEAVAAARESVEAARAAVAESARGRVDDRAPRVISLMEEPRWPPFVDKTRSRMPLANELRLWHERSVMQSSEASPAKPFIFDRDTSGFLWFRVCGVLLNEGAGTARVRLDGEAHFVEGSSSVLPTDHIIKAPPPVGTPDRNEFLLRPGEMARFEWEYGHTLGEWADAYERPDPPNLNGAAFLTITVFDYFEQGIVDHIYIEAGGRPITPVPGNIGQWTVPQDPSGAALGLVVYPTRRTYRLQADHEGELPWAETYQAEGKDPSN